LGLTIAATSVSSAADSSCKATAQPLQSLSEHRQGSLSRRPFMRHPPEKAAIGRESLNPILVRVGDVDAPVLRDVEVPWTVELAVGRALAAPLPHKGELRGWLDHCHLPSVTGTGVLPAVGLLGPRSTGSTRVLVSAGVRVLPPATARGNRPPHRKPSWRASARISEIRGARIGWRSPAQCAWILCVGVMPGLKLTPCCRFKFDPPR